MPDPDCLFCKIIAREIPGEIVFENEHALAFRYIAPAAPVHVLVMASNALLRDDFLPPPDKVGEQMLAFVSLPLNAIDWLAQEDALIAIRAKNVEDPMIEMPASIKEAEAEATTAAKAGDESGTKEALDKRKAALEDWSGQKRRIRIFNIALMPLLLIAFGLIRWQVRKSRRAKISL